MIRRLPDPVYLVVARVLTHPRFHPIHRRIYRRTAGRGLVGHILGMDMHLLRTTGRWTGAPRTVPLGAIPDGDAWVVIGSNGGRDADPGWVHNLRAEPRATIQLRCDSWPVIAHEADPPEAARIWPIVVAAYPAYPAYPGYRERTDRLIPLFVLDTAEAD